MAGENPVAVGVLACLVDLDATIHVPEAHGSVLRVGNQDFHARVEEHAADVVCVALESVHFPVLISAETPKLYSFVISRRC